MPSRPRANPRLRSDAPRARRSARGRKPGDVRARRPRRTPSRRPPHPRRDTLSRCDRRRPARRGAARRRCRCDRSGSGSRSPLRQPRRGRGPRPRASADACLAPAHCVFDATEEILIAVLRRRVLDVMQLRVETALLLAQGPRDDDVEVDKLIAAARAPEVRDALPAHAHHLPVLSAGRNPHLCFAAFDRRNADLVAERRLRRRDAGEVHEVVALAAEELMLFEADEHVEIAGRPAAHAGLALAGDAKLLPVVDAREDRERDLAVLSLAALAAAARADLVDRLSCAAAAWAGRHVDEAAEDRLLDLANLAAPVARAAGRDRRPGLGARPIAAFAGLEARHPDDPLSSFDRVEEVDLDLHTQVRAAHRTARLAAPEVASGKGLEEVADAEVAEAAAGGAEHVVALAALRVGEHLIGLGDLLEALRRVRSPVHIGVALPGELVVGTADLFVRRAPRDAQ